ncbi:MAG: hypothetical protein RLY30_1482 [Pseudomonadota bacterium]
MQPPDDLPLLSISDLNRCVSQVLERQLPLVRVQAEIAQATRAASGHWYLSLKDSVSSVRAVLFRREAAALSVPLREGLQVEVRAQPSLYEPRGDFQLRILSLRPAGEGDLYALFVRLRARLADEGLFDEGRKRPLPSRIRRVGVVTSLSGAALHDFLVTLGVRAPMIEVVIFPSLVQGADAPAALLAALARAQTADLDVLAVVRGGGSMEDLWAFNDEGVIRALARSPVPVVSGVGHETDTTLTDFVADFRAATPTAAAERIALAVLAERATLEQAFDRLQRSMHRRLDQAYQRLDRLQGALRSPRLELRAQADRLQRAQERMSALRMRGVDPWRRQLTASVKALEALSPLNVLARGYAVVTDQAGEPIAGVGDIHLHQVLGVRLRDGQLGVQVKSLDRPADTGRESSS